MDKLPLNDVAMLVSTINLLLRDNMCENLDDICQKYDVSRDELESILASKGFEYNAELNKVW